VRQLKNTLFYLCFIKFYLNCAGTFIHTVDVLQT